MINKITGLYIALLLPTLTIAQNVTKQEKGYFILTELGYAAGNHNYEVMVGPAKYDGGTSSAYAFSLRNINGVFVTNKISVGAGIGLENYTDFDSYFVSNNLCQLFLDVRYYFKNQGRTFFGYGDAGTGLEIDDNFRKGTMFNLGIGYKFKVAQKMGMIGSIGYNDQTIKGEEPLITRNRYYGFTFRVGLLL